MAMLPLPELLAELVRRPSVNPMGRTDLPPELLYESRVTAYLESHLRGLGVPVERQPVAAGRDNLVARYSPPGATRRRTRATPSGSSSTGTLLGTGRRP